MTETATDYQAESQIAESVDELAELNFKVAAIAGWTEIKEWHISRNQKANPSKKIYIGKTDHRESGIFIPDYTSDLSSIANVFRGMNINWIITQYTNSVVAWAVSDGNIYTEATQSETPAISLCKLLLKLHG